jgi:adenosine deaminase
MDILDDPLLTNRVAEARIPINVCPNSNVRIFNVYPSLEEHPFRRMREAGLLVTLNTDDPTMMDVNLGEEYRSVAKAMQFDFDAMAAISLDGIEASWLDESEKRSLRTIFQKDLDALRH